MHRAYLYDRELHERGFHNRHLFERDEDERNLYVQELHHEISSHVLPKGANTRGSWLEAKEDRGYQFTKRTDTPKELEEADTIKLEPWDLGLLNLTPGKDSKLVRLSRLLNLTPSRDSKSYDINKSLDTGLMKSGIKSKDKLKIGATLYPLSTILFIIGDHGAIVAHLSGEFSAIAHGHAKIEDYWITQLDMTKSYRLSEKLTKLWTDNKAVALTNPRIYYLPGPGFTDYYGPEWPRYAVRRMLDAAKIRGQLILVSPSNQGVHNPAGVIVERPKSGERFRFRLVEGPWVDEPGPSNRLSTVDGAGPSGHGATVDGAGPSGHGATVDGAGPSGRGATFDKSPRRVYERKIQRGHSARDLIHNDMHEADLFNRDLHGKGIYDRDLFERDLDEKNLYISKPQSGSGNHRFSKRVKSFG